MFIQSLTLRGIKSYREEVTITFREGINFIAGRNGAGKTTIIESIGYLLFWIRPYQYKDLLSTGAKEGYLSVVFRGNDERMYSIARELRKDKCKYVQLTDLQTGQSIEGEDVVREKVFQIHSIFSLDHLEEMFQEIVAVTQGKFTAPFLENGMEKKRKFQRMFGLETYEEAYKLSSTFPGMLKDEIHGLENTIRNLEGQLLQLPEEIEKSQQLTSTRETIMQHCTTLTNELQEQEKIALEQKKLKELLDTKEQELKDLSAQFLVAQEKEHSDTAQLEKSKAAKAICDQHQKEYLRYIETEKQLEPLSEQIAAGTLVEKQLQELIQSETKITTERAGLEKRLQILHEEIRESDLQTPVAEAKKTLDEVEHQKLILQKRKEKLSHVFELKTKIEKSLSLFRQEDLAQEKKKIEIRTLQSALAQFADLAERKKQLHQDSILKVEIEQQLQDHKTKLTIAEAELQTIVTQERICQDGACPTCGTKGDFSLHFSTKEEQKTQLIKDYQKEIARLEREQKKFADLEERKTLLLKNEEEERLLKVRLLESTETTSTELSKDIADHLEELLLYKIPALQIPKEITVESIQSLLAFLQTFYDTYKHDLEEESLVIQQRAQEYAGIIAKLSAKQSEQEKYQREKKEIEEQLLEIAKKHHDIQVQRKPIEAKLSEFHEAKKTQTSLQDVLKTTKPAHQEYLSHSKEAERIKDLENTLTVQQQALSTMKELGKKAKEAFQLLQGTFDKERFEQLQEKIGGIRASVKNALSEKERIEKEYSMVQQKLELLATKEKEKITLMEAKNLTEKKLRKMDFVRSVLNGAAEPIAMRFRTLLSDKAALFFRRLTQESSMLSWGEDFEVFLIKQEDHIRKFQQLSGGEQMIAALSIRLALMRYVSPFRIGFFDEPTQNLDEAHRRSLGNLLPHVLDGFEQLFLISHDDTFDALTDNVILLEKSEDGTKVVSF